MFEAYEVGVLLKLTNLISPQLLEITKQFEKLEALTVSYKKALGDLAIDTGPMRAISAAANASGRAFEKATLAAANYERELMAIRRMGGAVGAPTPMQAAALFGAPGVAGGAARGPRPIPLPGGGGGRNWHRGGPHGGNIHLGAGGLGMGSVGMAAGDWFWPLAAAGATVWAGHSLFESAKDLDTEKQRFRLFGMSEGQNREAFRYAGGMRVYGSTQVENMRAFRESQGVFRESGLSGSDALAGAKLAAPVLSKLNFLASSLDEESAATMKTANLNMLRYVESSGGLKSATEFNRLADFGYKLNVSSGGTVDWAQLRQFKARAGAAGFNLTDDAMSRLEPIIAEMKGGAVGFGLSTAFNRLTGSIRIPNQVAHQLVDQGIWDKSQVVFNQNGGIKTFKGNPLSKDNSNLLLTNPELFYEQVIRPIYDKMKFSATDIARENVMLFGTTGGRNMTLIENQIAAIHRSVDAMQKTKGIDDAMGIGKQSLSGQMKEFDSAWIDFKTNFGTSMLPFFTGILKAGSAILRYLPQQEDHSGQHYVEPKLFTKDWFWGQGAHWENDVSPGSPSGSNFIPPMGGGQSGTNVINVVADGQVLARVVQKRMEKQGGRPQTGTSNVDFSQALMPAGGMGFAPGF